MSWTLQAHGHNYGEGWTYDCKKDPTDAFIASRVSNNSAIPQGLTAILTRLAALGGPVTPYCRQSAYAGSINSYNQTSFEISLPAAVRAHSTVVLDLEFDTFSNGFSIAVSGGTAITHPPAWPIAWQPLTAYAIGATITDLFGSTQRVKLVNGLPTGTGISGSSRPTWNQTPTGTTNDGAGATAITWENIGFSGVQVGQILPGTGIHALTIVCDDCEPGPVTVTITANAGSFGHEFVNIQAAVHEYVGLSPAPIDQYDQDGLVGSTIGHVDVSVAASTPTQAFHLAVFVVPYVPGSPVTVDGGGVPLEPLEAWLVIQEPGEGFVDQTTRMFYGEGQQNSFSQQLRQRGTATVHLQIPAGDDYAPTQFTPLYLFDYTDADGYVLVFSGIIQDIEDQWLGTGGDRYTLLQVVSLESVLDTVYATPVQFLEQLAGDIVTSLFDTFLGAACPVQLGIISDGALIPLLNTNYEKISELLDQLAITSGLTWWVDPATQLLNFTEPSLVPAPIVLSDEDVLWESFSWRAVGSDYRNRQAVRADLDAFAQSGEFFVGAGQTQITLARPVQQVTNAYATLSTCNTATGTLTGLPADGDTITTGPASGAWQAGHVYGLGGIIVLNGFVQKVTTAGTSGGGIPTFSTITGNTTIDNTVIWTCLGPLGLGTGLQTYTFRNVINNTQFGEVLIGATANATAQNLVDAINATVTRAGVQLRGATYSLPTWENGQINAISLAGGTFTAQTKAAGTGWVTALAESASNFTWSAANTSGGTSPQGSLGKGYGATISLQVYTAGTSTAAPGLSYTPGSAVVNLATPLNAGSNLNIYYTRADGGVIEVEDTAQVAAIALLTGGTGKYQQIKDASSQGLISNSSAAALQLAQEALAAYSTIPKEFPFRTFFTGFYSGQQLEVLMELPTGALAKLNGIWIIMGIDAELIPCWPSLGPYGHYQYTLRLVNIEEVGSYMDFWAGLGGGSGGGGSATGIVATSGGALTPATGASGGVSVKTLDYTATSADSGFLLVMNAATAKTITLPAVAPSSGWTLFVQNIGAGSLTVARNGLNIDGAAANLTVPTDKGVYITTDGTNYYTERGLNPSGGGVSVKTADYTAVGTDLGTLLVMNSASAHTITLPAAPPSALWFVDIQNIGAGTLTVARNSLTIDGAAANLNQPTGTGVRIFTDGTNYFTQRGVAAEDAQVVFADITTGNVSSTKHGFAPKSPADATKFLNGAATPAYAQVLDSDLSTSDITTNNVSTAKHGFAPKLPNDATKYLDGTGAYTVPAGGGGGGAMVQISQQVLAGAAASVSFTGISAAYTSLRLVITARGSQATAFVGMTLRFNTDTAANYDYTQGGASGGAAFAQQVLAQTGIFIGNIPGSTATANNAGSATIEIPNYSATVFNKTVIGISDYNIQGGSLQTFLTGGQWRSTAAINNVTIITSAGNFIIGSVFTLYGIT